MMAVADMDRMFRIETTKDSQVRVFLGEEDISDMLLGVEVSYHLDDIVTITMHAVLGQKSNLALRVADAKIVIVVGDE